MEFMACKSNTQNKKEKIELKKKRMNQSRLLLEFL